MFPETFHLSFKREAEYAISHTVCHDENLFAFLTRYFKSLPLRREGCRGATSRLSTPSRAAHFQASWMIGYSSDQ